MLRNYFLGFAILLTVSFWMACADKDFGGDDWINYPDLEKLLKEKVDQAAPYNYLYVHQEGDKIDSSEVGSADIPWQRIEELFKKANLHNEKLNFKYKISVLTDTLTSSRTLFYEALDPDATTRTLNIISNSLTGDLQNIYFTLLDKGTFKDTQYRVLLIPKKLIQIQELNKSKTVIDTYVYPDF